MMVETERRLVAEIDRSGNAIRPRPCCVSPAFQAPSPCTSRPRAPSGANDPEPSPYVRGNCLTSTDLRPSGHLQRMCKRPAKPLKGAPASWRHDDRKGWKSALQYPFRTVDIKSRRSLYTATTVRRRSARWRTCEAHHRTVVSRLALAGRERLRSPPVFRKAALAIFPPAFAV
jgi:hypothetical protein